MITPSFNQAAYLPAMLESVAMQDYPHVEHIVMDGGSSDGSVELLEEWAKTHAIRWQSGEDGGQADAIQQAVESATGDVVTWLNSDDVYLDPRVLADVMARFEPGVSVVTGAGWYLSEAGEKMRHIPVFPTRVGYETLRWVDWVLQPSTFIRRDVFLRFPLDTSLHYAFDWDFFIRLSREHTFVAIERDVAGYRIHPTGKTTSGAARRQQELVSVSGRYNPPTSIRHLALRVIASAHRAGEHLPRPLYRVMTAAISRFAMLTHHVADGRGIQL